MHILSETRVVDFLGLTLVFEFEVTFELGNSADGYIITFHLSEKWQFSHLTIDIFGTKNDDNDNG